MVLAREVSLLNPLCAIIFYGQNVEIVEDSQDENFVLLKFQGLKNLKFKITYE